jgi:hypothetical protein
MDSDANLPETSDDDEMDELENLDAQVNVKR